jgi:hypothetical protein
MVEAMSVRLTRRRTTRTGCAVRSFFTISYDTRSDALDDSPMGLRFARVDWRDESPCSIGDRRHPKRRRNARVNTSWLLKPQASAMPRTGWFPVSNSAAARLRPSRRPNCFGVSPAATENIRCSRNGDSPACSARDAVVRRRRAGPPTTPSSAACGQTMCTCVIAS